MRLSGYIGVIGPGEGAAAADCAVAEQVGRQLALAGAAVLCGGLGGVMAAACRGAAACGGVTVGLLPGDSRAAGNEFLTVALPTGLGELRNGLIVRASDALIAIGGSWGTLSEIALAMRTGKSVVTVGGWQVVDGQQPGLAVPVPADSAGQAVRLALSLARGDGGQPQR